MLGHNSIKTTQHYAKVLDAKTALDMAALAQKVISNTEIIVPGLLNTKERK